MSVQTADEPRDTDPHWQRELETAVRELGVPGAVLGILNDGSISTSAAGVLGAATQVEATTDSVFQYGSIGKVWTTTVIMQLVDEGLLRLDDPVRSVLPDFRVADSDASDRITVRHLLTHASGIEGDLFTDTGRGDDCIERYVAELAGAGQLYPVGEAFSYCNAGFVVAGRVIEVLTGLTWDEAIAQRISKPLGLTSTLTLPEDALLHRAAIGHLPDTDGHLTQAQRWMLPRAIGPAGLVSGTAEDLLVFVRMHLDGGVSTTGTRVLSGESTREMTEQHHTVPAPSDETHSWGLGWFRGTWAGHDLIGHDGVTIGQQAYLRVLPGRSTAVVVLTNGGRTAELADRLFRAIFAQVAGVDVPPTPAPSAVPVPVDASRLTGTYRSSGARVEVAERDGDLSMRVTLLQGPHGETVQEHALLPAGPDQFVFRPPHTQWWVPVHFYRRDDGSDHVYVDLRSTPKVEPAP